MISKIFKAIVAAVAIVVFILMEQKKIPFLIGVPFTLVTLCVAFFKDIIDLFKKETKKDISPLVDKLVEITSERDKLKRDLQEATQAKLDAEYANKDNLSDYKQIALELRAEGKSEEAIAFVDTDEADKDAAERHIFKAELLIDNFQFDEAEQHYKQSVAIFPTYDNNFEIADFYFNLNKFSEAKEYYKHCLNLTNLPEEKAKVHNGMGKVLYKSNDYTKAEASYKKALKIYRNFTKDNPKTYLPEVAKTLNNLATVYWKTKEYQRALEEYEEALRIRRLLAKENPNAYLPDVAKTLNNLANLHSDINKHPNALIEYEEALKIYRKLAEENPKEYFPNMATTLHNLGLLYSEINEYSNALEKYEEALKIYRKLAEESPKAYYPDVATILNNLANLHRNIKEYSKALEEYEEALKIRRKFANESPKAFFPDVATTLNHLSEFYQDIISNKELSLQYASEAVEVIGKCNATSSVSEQLEKAKRVIEKWNNQ